MKRWSVAVVCASAALGCAGASSQAAGARVRDAHTVDVDGCTYLGDFMAGGTVSGATRANGWSDRNQVRSKAAAHGATDIVWSFAGRGTVETGAAYACP
jgi:hypothetical protein